MQSRAKIIRWFASLIELFLFFFRSIIDVSAAEEFSKKKRGGYRGGYSGSGNGGGGGGDGGNPPRKPPPPRGPRIMGLGDIRNAGGNCAAGA